MTIEPKYKIGDYLAGTEFIFFRVVVIVNQDSNNPIYGLQTIKSISLQWQTQFELEKRGIVLKEPDFKKFNSIEPGDVVYLDKKDESREYMSVLARINDICLLSSRSDAQAKMVLDMDTFFAESVGNGQGILSPHDKEQMNLAINPSIVNKSAGEWYSTETMALMNWDVIRGEED